MHLLAHSLTHAQPVRGRTVPVIDGDDPRDRPVYPLLARVAPTHADGSRAYRRMLASPRIRPVPSDPLLRAQAAFLRIRTLRARQAAT